MIQKVSEHEKVTSLENGRSFERGSMNQGAVDSFTKVVIDSAKGMIAKGGSVNAAAAKFNLSADFLSKALEIDPGQKIECSCDDEEYVPEMKSATRKKVSSKDRELNEEEIAAMEAYNALHKKPAQHTPVLSNISSKRILSGKGNDQTDFGGARKQMGYERNNSIFDTEVIERASKVRSNDEILRDASQKKEEERSVAKKSSRYETIDGESIVEKLQQLNQGKANGITSASVQEAHAYDKKLPSRGISIFDTDDFERVPEKTAGEMRRSEIKESAAKPKDRSWVQNGSKSVTSTDIVDKFIASMMGEKKKG